MWVSLRATGKLLWQYEKCAKGSDVMFQLLRTASFRLTPFPLPRVGGDERTDTKKPFLQDECFALGLEYERRDLRDADIEPEDRIFLRINFKHLGSVESF